MSSSKERIAAAAAAEAATQAEQQREIVAATKALAIDVLPTDKPVTAETGLARVTYERLVPEAEHSFWHRMFRPDSSETQTIKFAVLPGDGDIHPVVNVHYEATDGIPQQETGRLPVVDSTLARVNTVAETVDFGKIVAFPELETAALHRVLSTMQASGIEPTIDFFPPSAFDPR